MSAILLTLAVLLLVVSCDPEGKVIQEGSDNICQVEGHNRDFHAVRYDFTAGTPMTYDVVDGQIIYYKVPVANCTTHSFEVWRCARCGAYFKVYIHSYANGVCTVCGACE